MLIERWLLNKVPIIRRKAHRCIIEDDGKWTIYGYLAKPSDMIWIKPFISKLSIESYMKKVLEPIHLYVQLVCDDKCFIWFD